MANQTITLSPSNNRITLSGSTTTKLDIEQDDGVEVIDNYDANLKATLAESGNQNVVIASYPSAERLLPKTKALDGQWLSTADGLPVWVDFPVSEDDEMYTSRVDFVGDDLIYQGEAEPGSLEHEPKWRIKLITFDATGDIETKWAGGSAEFHYTWSNRLTLEYR